MVSNELDLREKWMGLKMLRKGYHTLKTEEGTRIKVSNKAAEAARFFAPKIWGNQNGEKQQQNATEKQEV